MTSLFTLRRGCWKWHAHRRLYAYRSVFRLLLARTPLFALVFLLGDFWKFNQTVLPKMEWIDEGRKHINLKDFPSFYVPPICSFLPFSPSTPPLSLFSLSHYLILLAISLVSRMMATMNRRNLAHGNTLMHLSATFPFWNGRPATTPISEVPVLMDLRVTWSRFSNQSSEIMRRSEGFIFTSTLGNVLLPQARRREVSYMLSHIQHSDPEDNDFWINQICSFTSQAAPEAVQNHGLVLLADIIIECTEFHAFFEGVQEISEPLTLGEIFDGKEWFGSTPDGKSSDGRKLERAIYTTAGFQESECVICLEKFDPGVEVAKMPCSHIFDEHCIAGWLERSPLCPLCRFAMPSGNGKGN